MARGYIAAALDRCLLDDKVALSICGVWSDLDEPGRLPEALEPDLATGVSWLLCLEYAHDTLRSAIPSIEPVTRCAPITASLRRLHDLINELDDDPTGDEPDRS
ncbi:MAG: hypothetical protein ACOH2F_16105 [Cellulomonas sp.]